MRPVPDYSSTQKLHKDEPSYTERLHYCGKQTTSCTSLASQPKPSTCYSAL